MLGFLGRRQPSASDENVLTYLLVGLGNPGREYRANRHNLGFMTVDQLSQSLSVRLSRVQSKALIGIGALEQHKVVLAKPQTFMNLSGQAVSALLRFYKIPLERLLVIHDELDLPLGTLRLRPGGGSAGNRGLASIIELLGTQEFPRLRIGIGHPPGQMSGADYVLQNFPPAEQEMLDLVLKRAVEAAQVFVKSGLETAMNQYNGSLQKE
ncbi:MAG: aminoacyl-tRNA hydrolase [Anaerolineaceae bacterium]|nr:aminoacyl-tRNA hydrolase [Anaerolineaceae bacterium]